MNIDLEQYYTAKTMLNNTIAYGYSVDSELSDNTSALLSDISHVRSIIINNRTN